MITTHKQSEELKSQASTSKQLKRSAQLENKIEQQGHVLAE